MKSTDIVDRARRPLSAFTGVTYASAPREVLDAAIRSGADTTVLLGLSQPDTSIYEFPGDLTYARYLEV